MSPQADDFRFPLNASLCALVTPMRTDGSLCLKSLHRLVEFHCQSGTAGLVLNGTTGESGALSAQERRQTVSTAVKAAAGALPIIAGTGTADPRRSIELSRQAQAAGADGCMLVTPPYSRPPQEGLYRHFMTIAEAIPLPVMLYNVPHRTACDLLPETTARLSRHPRILAIKDSLGGERFRTLRQLLEEPMEQGFRLYGGTDDLLMENLLEGAQGIVSVTANLLPQKMAAACALFASGKQARAAAIHEQLLPLHKALFAESNPTAIKWAMGHTGLLPDAEGIRLPLLPASDATRRELLPLLASLTTCGPGV